MRSHSPQPLFLKLVQQRAADVSATTATARVGVQAGGALSDGLVEGLTVPGAAAGLLPRASAAWGAIGLAVAALAASWLLTVGPGSYPSDTGLVPQPTIQVALEIDNWMDSDFDDELEALNSELTDLSIELLTL